MDTAPTDPLVNLTRSVDAFGRTIDHLQDDYAALERRYAELNAELVQNNQQLQIALAANRQLAGYLDSVLAEVPAGIIAVDGDGIVRLYNPAAAALLELPAEQVVQRHYHDVWPERAADTATAAACAAGHPPVAQSRRELQRAERPPIALSVCTVPLSGHDTTVGGRPAGALEVFTDLSAFESLHAEMARMSTLAALGEMAATIAHEIRNPLGGMMGFAELLARRADDDSMQREMAAKIVAGAQQLSRMVQRLLEFARDPKLEPKPVEWPRFFQMALDQYEDNARQRGKRLKLIRRWPERLPRGRADVLCLRQALWNILENAEQAVDPGGEIEVTASALPDGGLRLQVADRGHGVDPGVLDRAFVPFVTTREKGTGLGLATAKKIVEAHGGRISLRNRAGGGAEVCIELPAATA